MSGIEKNKAYQLTSDEEVLIHRIRSELTSVIAPTPWIVATSHLVTSLHIAKELMSVGASSVLAIGVVQGVGMPESHPPEIELLCLDQSTASEMMSEIRQFEQTLDQLPTWALDKVEAFDPEKKARAIRAIYSTSSEVAGRPVFGSRPTSWVALEDKLVVDELWDLAGVKRAPIKVVSLHLDDIYAAYKEVDQGHGVVIAGDNRSGWHGGASRTRWAKDIQQVRQIVESLSQECDRARVMPYLEGISCSMHGWVTEDAMISLRPCEMLVYPSKTKETYFDYAGIAIRWEPNDLATANMRTVVEKTAFYLRDQYQYRGSFTIDGVLCGDDFYPTEINPRMGGGLGRIAGSLPQLPLLLLHYASIEGGLDRVTKGVNNLQNSKINWSLFKNCLLRAAYHNPVVRATRSLKDLCQDEIKIWYRLEVSEHSYDWSRVTDRYIEGVSEIDRVNFAQISWGKGGSGSVVIARLPAKQLPLNRPSIDAVLSLIDRFTHDFNLT